MQNYELRLLATDGRTIAMYGFEAADDENAMASIFAVGDVAYDRYEVWRGMVMINEGARFICANRVDSAFNMSGLPH
ncbi:MAG: hypothetical protein WDM91_19080 [Rhizomicrobium sp.]